MGASASWWSRLRSWLRSLFPRSSGMQAHEELDAGEQDFPETTPPWLNDLDARDDSLGSTLLGLDRKAAVEALSDGTTRVLPAGHNIHREALDPWLAALDAWLVP